MTVCTTCEDSYNTLIQDIIRPINQDPILKHPQVRFRGLGWFVCVNQLINLIGGGGGGGGAKCSYIIAFATLYKNTFTRHYSFIISVWHWQNCHFVPHSALRFLREQYVHRWSYHQELIGSPFELVGIYPHGKRALMRAIVKSFYKYANNPWPFKPQYPLANSPNWSLYISLKNKLREFEKRSKHFLFGDHFINSYNLISW